MYPFEEYLVYSQLIFSFLYCNVLAELLKICLFYSFFYPNMAAIFTVQGEPKVSLYYFLFRARDSYAL